MTRGRRMPGVVAVSRAPACPECAQGKHPNCDGRTWDPETDGPAVCPCWARGHTTPEET